MLPLVIYFFYVKVFDNHSYRGGIPWGFFHYQANINTVFLPNQTFLSVWLQNLGIKISPWEGWAYIGLGGDMVLLFILVYLVKKGVRKNRITLRIVPLPKTLQTAFWASLIILFYSMGFPFNLFKPMADWFSVIQQFRALGRFAWVFYYVIGTVVFYWVYLIARKKMIKQKKTTFYYVVFILTLIYFLEGVPYHLLTKDMITNRLNYFDEKQLPESYQFKLHTVNQYKWQAILPLPFYHLGAEVFTKSAPETLIFQSMIFSYHASVPMMASNGSRTSMEEARKLIQVVSPPNIYKDIAKEMPCHYPLLVLPDSASMNIFEKYYFEQARKISNDVYSLSCEKLFEVNKNYREPECDTVIYLSFDNVSTSFKNERGVFVTEKSKHKTLLAKHVYLPHQTVQKYKVSFWVYYTTIDEALPNMIIETPGRWQLIDFKNPEIIEKDRMRFSGTFKLRENETEVAILISGNLLEKKQVYIDDLTICKTN
ncbi:MAG: hypothetical protein D6707_07345 [Bacteroidetes bacterium]|nr:MAG: hypothetical protein D6707_07345 [Bacteroidota bacterium]